MCLLNVFRNIPGIQERGSQLEAYCRKRYLPEQEVKEEEKVEKEKEEEEGERVEEEGKSKLQLDDDEEEEEIPLFTKPSPQ